MILSWERPGGRQQSNFFLCMLLSYLLIIKWSLTFVFYFYGTKHYEQQHSSNFLTTEEKNVLICWQWHPTPVLLPGKSHGQRSLVGCSLWGHEESDTTERLPFHFSLSCIGEGNGNPLQCFCLENPRDGGAWWAAVYGVAQSRTRLKRLSSSNKDNFPLSHLSAVTGRSFISVSLCTHVLICQMIIGSDACTLLKELTLK